MGSNDRFAVTYSDRYNNGLNLVGRPDWFLGARSSICRAWLGRKICSENTWWRIPLIVLFVLLFLCAEKLTGASFTNMGSPACISNHMPRKCGMKYCLFVCFISKSFLTYSFFPLTPALSTISRPLSSSMCSITPETANVGSSYNRMWGPGIGCWFSDRSNCSLTYPFFALALGHQWPQCWVMHLYGHSAELCTHTFQAVYRLK